MPEQSYVAVEQLLAALVTAMVSAIAGDITDDRRDRLETEAVLYRRLEKHCAAQAKFCEDTLSGWPTPA